MTFPKPLLAGALLLAASMPAFAQDINAVTADEGTVGDVLVIDGNAFGTKKKPKVFLVLSQSEAKTPVKGKAPKIKLKVLESSDTQITVELKKVSKKAPIGLYDVHVKPKGGQEVVEEDGFRLRPPVIEAVDPDSVSPGATVNLTVRHYGARGKHSACVGSSDARITAETDNQDGTWTIAITVPQLPNGRWPVCVRNDLGEGVLKSGLEVTGSTVTAADVGTSLSISAVKKFKVKPQNIAIDEQNGPETNVGVVGGSKGKPLVLGISMDTTIADLAAGDAFDGTSGLIQFSQTKKKGTQVIRTWSTTANQAGEDFAIQVVSRDDECAVLFLCGTLRLALGDGAECISVYGTVKSPVTPQDEVPSDSCNALTTATGSLTGAFSSDPQKNIGLKDVAGPGSFKFSTGTPDGNQGFPDQVLTFTVSDFDPNSTPLPATYDAISLTGKGLTDFTLQLDTVIYSIVYDPQTLAASMSVTITEVISAPPNEDGILACIRGTFTGSLGRNDPERTPQTFSGSFEIPWYDVGFGQ